MANPIWSGFAAIVEIVGNAIVPATVRKVDAILASIMEAIADVLPTATAPLLREGSDAARAAFEALQRSGGIDEESPSFVAGRLSAALDVLAYASYQTADEAVVALARTQPYGRVLVALAARAMRNVDLAGELGKDEAQVSKWLGTLREHGAVTSHRRGREVFNALSPVGRLVVEQGWQDERRAPLDTVNVLALEASRWDLNKRRTPDHVTHQQLPRISAASK